MINSILRKDLLPVKCGNPECGCQYDAAALTELFSQRGVVYADCGDTVFQGFSCINCNHTTLAEYPRSSPFIDLSKFILQPCSYKKTVQAIQEQILLEVTFVPGTRKKLKYFKAWYEEETPGYQPRKIDYFLEYADNTLFPKREIINEILEEENSTGLIRLRRLYPDTTFFRSLFTLVAPKRMYPFGKTEFYTGESSVTQNREKNEAFLTLFEIIYGKTIKQVITEAILSEYGIVEFTKNDYHHVCNKFLNNHTFFEKINLIEATAIFDKVGWEKNVANSLDLYKAVDLFVSEVKKELPFEKSRAELSGWTDLINKKHALFVNAPMGLGKSYNIIKFLSTTKDHSSVVFMPNKEMCREIAENLRIEIARKIKREDFCKINDSTGSCNYRCNDYLTDEIFLVEGINEECSYFNKIIEGYKSLWNVKSNFCKKCEKSIGCKFLRWTDKARRARVVVATHRLYDLFNINTSLHYWERNGDAKAVKRDTFIIDEDLILNNCYVPTVLKINVLKKFLTTFFEFLNTEFKNHKANKDIINKLNILLGRLVTPEKSTLIPPIDKKFKIPEEFKKKWGKSYDIIEYLVPDYVNEISKAANLLNIVEHGIKYGIVIQRFTPKSSGSGTKGEVFNLFFPNPKNYKLRHCPPHVFFDGTKLPDDFLQNKLPDVEIKLFNIQIDARIRHVVWQNTNTDISSTNADKEQEKVLQALSGIFAENGADKRYYIHTSKFIRDQYLDNFISQCYPKLDIKKDHYGNIRGKNSAKDTDVHIMVGSFTPPDALEIAMGLEFIQEQILGREPFATKNNLWTFAGSKSIRKYKPEYSKIEEIAKTYRHSEQRQALARSRYLFHPVTFYIFAKEPVHEYEPYFYPQQLQYREDLFKPRKMRDDNKYEKVKSSIIEAFSAFRDENSENTGLSDHFIAKRYKLNRETVRKHREQLEAEGFIKRISERFYTLTNNV